MNVVLEKTAKNFAQMVILVGDNNEFDYADNYLHPSRMMINPSHANSLDLDFLKHKLCTNINNSVKIFDD